jgi:hypothetical protein
MHDSNLPHSTLCLQVPGNEGVPKNETSNVSLVSWSGDSSVPHFAYSDSQKSTRFRKQKQERSEFTGRIEPPPVCNGDQSRLCAMLSRILIPERTR